MAKQIVQLRILTENFDRLSSMKATHDFKLMAPPLDPMGLTVLSQQSQALKSWNVSSRRCLNS